MPGGAGGFGGPGQPSEQDRQRFRQEIMRNPELRLKLTELMPLLMRKGIDPMSGKQPGMAEMMKIMADSEIRNKLIEIAKLLQEAGFTAGGAGAAGLSQLLMGGGAPLPAPQASKTVDSAAKPAIAEPEKEAKPETPKTWSSLLSALRKK
ncbi:hypothetical protein HK105_201413 [Polyrhizophydium stewartii]|uniref:Uncharacterized protein n=1 Tax=Polyrhizophydium stewartii TaxID=2732419 RepID=A0ABR4NI46_9FUNG